MPQVMLEENHEYLSVVESPMTKVGEIESSIKGT